jgi:WD40 repeat protein
LRTAAISPDGKSLVTSDSSPSVQVWDMQTGNRRSSIGIPIDRSPNVFPQNTPEPVDEIKFSPRGKYILLTQGYIGAFQFDFTSGNLTRLISQSQLQGDVVLSGAYSPDERYLVIATPRQSVMVDISTNTIARILGPANLIQYSPDGRYILTSQFQGNTRLWELASSKVVHVFTGDQGELSPDGHYVLTATLDGTATLWDTQTATSQYKFKGNSKPINRFDFSPDSRFILISSDGAVWLWDLQTVLGVATEAAH